MANVLDSEDLARHAAFAKAEAHIDIVTTAAKAMTDTARYVSERDHTQFEKQAGKQMPIATFETKLKALCPALAFDTNKPGDNNLAAIGLSPGTTCRRVFHDGPEGMQYLCSYQNHPLLPEFTVFITREKIVPVPYERTRQMWDDETRSWITVPFFDPKDAPKSRRVDNEDGTWHYEFDKGPVPGQAIEREVAGQLVGWRTVLARLVGYKLITPTQAEHAFGSPENENWAIRMGRKEGQLAV